MSGARAPYSLAARQSLPISSLEYPSLLFHRNFPAPAAVIFSPSSAALMLPAPFCSWDPVSARFQTPAPPLPSCSDPRKVAPATRAPQPAADIPIALALSAHIP